VGLGYQQPIRWRVYAAVQPVAGGASWVETVRLLPRNQVPLPEPQAAWETTASQCCQVYYISGTQAEADLPQLLESLDAQARDASQRMGTELSDPIPVVLLPRVLGHGGFASNEITVSHLVRNYMGGSQDIIFHHEMVHLLDARLGGDLRPAALVEGLAVYLSGGHFKPEPLLDRAAALLPPDAGCTAWSPPSRCPIRCTGLWRGSLHSSTHPARSFLLRTARDRLFAGRRADSFHG